MALSLQIVTPVREVFAGEAADVVVPGFEGEFQVLPGHDLLLSLLRGGVLSFRDAAGKEQRFVVGRGFAEAGGDRVTVLTDRCDSTAGIDKHQAERDRQAAEKAMVDTDASSAERVFAEEQYELAVARLQA